jgi:hypothetical protein
MRTGRFRNFARASLCSDAQGDAGGPVGKTPRRPSGMASGPSARSPVPSALGSGSV